MGASNNSEKGLGNQWRNFISTIFHPPVIVFLFGTIGLLIASYFTNNKLIIALISALMITSAAIFGSFIRKRWEELTEKPHLLSKGKMAVRNLRLLSNNIGYYELRLRKYIDRINNNDISKERMLEYFEEIMDWCLCLKEICLTSIENWEDIIPEVKDLTSKIGTLFDLRINEEQLNNQIASVSKKLEELEQEQGKSDEEKETLLNKLKEKEEEVRKVEKQVKELRESIRSSIGGLTTSTLATSGSGYNALTGAIPWGSGYSALNPLGYVQSMLTKATCQSCKKVNIVPSSIATAISEYICEDCRKKRKGTDLA